MFIAVYCVTLKCLFNVEFKYCTIEFIELKYFTIVSHKIGKNNLIGLIQTDTIQTCVLCLVRYEKYHWCGAKGWATA